MATGKTDRRMRQIFKKKLLDWGMNPFEVELCMVQVKHRQWEKARGKLPINASLCTRESYKRYLEDINNKER